MSGEVDRNILIILRPFLSVIMVKRDGILRPEAEVVGKPEGLEVPDLYSNKPFETSPSSQRL